MPSSHRGQSDFSATDCFASVLKQDQRCHHIFNHLLLEIFRVVSLHSKILRIFQQFCDLRKLSMLKKQLANIISHNTGQNKQVTGQVVDNI
eukprot:766116-Hanusia_phi.AAC.2